MSFCKVIFKVNLFERENFTGNKVATKSVNLHSQKLPVYVYGMSGTIRILYTCQTMMISFVILETFYWKRNCFQLKMCSTILSLNQAKHSIRTHNMLSRCPVDNYILVAHQWMLL